MPVSDERKRAAWPPGVPLPRRAKLVRKGRRAAWSKACPFIHPLGNRQHRRAMIAKGLLEPDAEWRETLRELRRMNKDEELDAIITYDQVSVTSVTVNGETLIAVDEAATFTAGES